MPAKFLPPPFRCDVEPGVDGSVLLRPLGELDMSSGPILQACLQKAHAEGNRRLVVDLRGLEFMDSTGLTLLTRWSLGAERSGYELALIAGSDRIQRLFELTGLITHFHFVDG